MSCVESSLSGTCFRMVKTVDGLLTANEKEQAEDSTGWPSDPTTA